MRLFIFFDFFKKILYNIYVIKNKRKKGENNYGI